MLESKDASKAIEEAAQDIKNGYLGEKAKSLLTSLAAKMRASTGWSLKEISAGLARGESNSSSSCLAAFYLIVLSQVDRSALSKAGQIALSYFVIIDESGQTVEAAWKDEPKLRLIASRLARGGGRVPPSKLADHWLKLERAGVDKAIKRP